MVTVLFQAFGGLGMFLYGMKIMSEGLQKFAGSRLRQHNKHGLWTTVLSDAVWAHLLQP
jgi:Na+/phosphate symporter